MIYLWEYQTRCGHVVHSSYLSQTPQTLSVDQKNHAESFSPHDNFACHGDQNCSTWQSILHHMTKLLEQFYHVKQWHIAPHLQFVKSLHTTKLLHMKNLRCMLSFRDLHCFDAISILTQFTLELNILVCGAKIWCMTWSFFVILKPHGGYNCCFEGWDFVNILF